MPLATVIKQEVLPGPLARKSLAAAAVEFLLPDGDRTRGPGCSKPWERARPSMRLLTTPARLRDRHPEEAWRTFLLASARSRSVEAWGSRLQIEDQPWMG